MEFSEKLKTTADYVNNLLTKAVREQLSIADNMFKPIQYTLESPGKRLRGCIVLWVCEVISGQINSNAAAAATAVEMIHAYSLVHDDLPAMDDDDFRRGKPTCHKEFDEATAILTGDALLTLAFEHLAKEVTSAKQAVKMIRELASAAGPDGMIAGQMADMNGESQTGDIGKLQYIHTNKTARIFQCSAVLGALAANADEAQIEALREYGLKLGLGFQVADDILDVSSSTRQLGKTAGKDATSGKMTYPGLIGMDESKKLEINLANQACEGLEIFGASSSVLRQLAQALVQRVK